MPGGIMPHYKRVRGRTVTSGLAYDTGIAKKPLPGFTVQQRGNGQISVMSCGNIGRFGIVFGFRLRMLRPFQFFLDLVLKGIALGFEPCKFIGFAP